MSDVNDVVFVKQIKKKKNTTSSGHFGREIRRPFVRAKSHNFQVFLSRYFFQTRFKLWNSVLKMLNFQTIEELISLHIYFKATFCRGSS